MKKIIPLAAVLLFLMPGRLSQAQIQERANALEAETWSLMFGMNGLLQFSSFESMIAAKYHRTANKALRMGLGLRVNDSEANSNAFVRFLASLQFVRYPDVTREVLFFYGAGPRIVFDHRRLDGIGNSQNVDELGLGGVGVLGAEWFATKHISLLLEYGLAAQIRLIDIDREAGTAGKFQDYSIEQHMTVGVTAYF